MRTYPQTWVPGALIFAHSILEAGSSFPYMEGEYRKTLVRSFGAIIALRRPEYLGTCRRARVDIDLTCDVDWVRARLGYPSGVLMLVQIRCRPRGCMISKTVWRRVSSHTWRRRTWRGLMPVLRIECGGRCERGKSDRQTAEVGASRVTSRSNPSQTPSEGLGADICQSYKVRARLGL